MNIFWWSFSGIEKIVFTVPILTYADPTIAYTRLEVVFSKCFYLSFHRAMLDLPTEEQELFPISFL